MVTRSQKIRLGIFISVGLIALFGILIVVVAPKFFEKRDMYYVGYRGISLTGLQGGSSVKYQGLTVGYVSNIYIDPKDIERVIIQISLDEGTPIKEDTYADIEFVGITGLKIIELRGSTNETAHRKPGDFIRSGKSTAEMFTGKAEVMMEKLDHMLNNLSAITTVENQKKIIDMVDYTSKNMSLLYNMLLHNKDNLYNALEQTEDLMTASTITMKNMQRITSSDSLDIIISNLVAVSENLRQADLVTLVHELNGALKQTNDVLHHMDANLTKTWVDFSVSVESIRESSEYLNQFSRMITEDPSLLVRGTKPVNPPDNNLE